MVDTYNLFLIYMDKAIVEQMKKLGFSEKEIMIYLTILRIQKARLAQIVKNTEIKRTTAYHCIDKLLKRGLVTIATQEDKKFYIPEDPKDALNYLINEQKDVVADILPDLTNIIGDNAIYPKIKVYRQQAGMKKLLEYQMNCKEKVIRYYLSEPNVDELVGEKFVDDFLKKLTKKRVKTGVNIRALRSLDYSVKREKGILHSQELRAIRFLPKNVKIKPFILMFDNKVIIISSTKEKLGFIIESQDFADAQKIIFDMLWENLK